MEQHCAIRDVKIMHMDGYIADDEITALMVPHPHHAQSSIAYRVLGHLSPDIDTLNAKCLHINKIAGKSDIINVFLLLKLIYSTCSDAKRTGHR